MAAGSNVLTKATANPLPVLLFLFGVIVLGIWIASRTSWKPSPPLRLARRRRWGGLVTAMWALYREHKLLFVAIGALFVPLGILITAGAVPAVSDLGARAAHRLGRRANAYVAIPALLLGTLLTIAGLAFVQAAVAAAMQELDHGRPATARKAYGAAFGRLRPLLGALLRAAVVVLVLELTVVGSPVAIWLLVRWSLIAQVIQIEGHPGGGALRRSGEIVSGRWMRVASITVVGTGIALLTGPLIGALLLLLTSASFNFVNLVAGIVYMLTLPLAAITTTYLYYDLRARAILEPDDEVALGVQPAEI